MTAPHRLVTRSDFDGLVCAILLRELDLVDEILFVHPKDVQDGVVENSGGTAVTVEIPAEDLRRSLDETKELVEQNG